MQPNVNAVLKRNIPLLDKQTVYNAQLEALNFEDKVLEAR